MTASAPNSTSSSNNGLFSWFTSRLPWSSSSGSSVENRTAELAGQITTAPLSDSSLKTRKRQFIPTHHIPAHKNRQYANSFLLSGVQSVKMMLSSLTGTGEAVTHLDFSNNIKISDEELIEEIESNPNLEGLNLQGCYRLTEKSFAYLSTLTNLKYLNVNYCTRVSVQALENIPMLQMQHLELRGYPIDDNLIFTLFADAINLVYLDLACYSFPIQFTPSASSIGDVGFAVLSQLSNLEYLDLSYLQYNGDGLGLMVLRKLENLTTLNMMMEAEYIENDVELYQMIGSMESLRIWIPPMILKHPESIQGLQNSQLEVLKFPWLSKNISDQLQYLPITLQELTYNPSISVRDTAFYTAIGRLTNLRSLSITGTLDGNLVGQYWGNINQLRELNIENLVNSLGTLCELNPHLQKISIDMGLYENISPICKLPFLDSLQIFGIDNPNMLVVELARQDPVPPLSLLSIGALNPNDPDELVNEGINALTAFSKTLTSVQISVSYYNPMFDGKAAVAPLNQLTELTDFSFQGPCSIESCAAMIAPMKKLKSLIISPFQSPDSAESPNPLFQAIGELPALNSLSLLNCYGVKNDDFAELWKNLKLRSLDLDAVGGSYGDGAVRYLEGIRSLSVYSSINDDTAPISSQALAELEEDLHLQVCQSQLLTG